jgi:hypothetical protein
VAEKSNWKFDVLEDAVVITVLIGIGIIVAAAKLAPVLLRWAKNQ